jgi:hypothetical protein
MPQDKRYLYCDYDVCQKKLIDFCYACNITGKYFCDDTCRDRAVQEETPRARFLWQ